MEDHPGAGDTGLLHFNHIGLTLRQFLDNSAGKLVIDVDYDFLDWLQSLSRLVLLIYNLFNEDVRYMTAGMFSKGVFCT